MISRPALLEGRNELDTAALLHIDRTSDAVSAEIERYAEAAEPATASEYDDASEEEEEGEEERRLEAYLAGSAAAARRYLAALFPAAASAELDDAYARAEALDRATARVVLKEYGYPGHEGDDPPDPRAVCPGFGSDIHVRAHGRPLHELR